MKDSQKYLDVVIVGGGPAGCAAALTLLNRTSLKVGIIESTNFNNLRVGESVSPSFLSLMRYLNVEGEFFSDIHLPSNGIESSWGSSNLHSRDFFFTGQGNGWNLDRQKFDQMMAKEVKKRNGVIHTSSKVIEQKINNNQWELTIAETSGEKFLLHSDFVIDASGKSASFARRLGATWKVLDTLVGIVSIYKINNIDEEYQGTMLESAPNGWFYSTLISDNRRIVVFMTDGDIAKESGIQKKEVWSVFIKKTMHIQKTISNAEMIVNPTIVPAYSQIIRKMDLAFWAPAGDALASFDPLSSIGIGHAIVSGIETARIANDTINSDGSLIAIYLEKALKNFYQYLNNRVHFYNYEKRWKDNLFWRRRENYAPFDWN